MTPANDRLGTVLHDGDTIGLRYVRHLDHGREKVWRALTESDHLRHWFPCDIVGERVAGAELTLPFWPDHVEEYGIEPSSVPGRLHVWDPPHVFEWSWDTDRLRFELTTSGNSTTTLTLTVWIGDPRGHGVDGSPDDATGTARAATGYHVCLDHLEAVLDTGTAGPLAGADSQSLQDQYVTMVG